VNFVLFCGNTKPVERPGSRVEDGMCIKLSLLPLGVGPTIYHVDYWLRIFFCDGNDYLFRSPECHFRFLERRLKHVSWIPEIHSKRRKKICHFKQTLKIYIQLQALTHKMDKVVRFCYGYRSESEPPLERFFCGLLAVI
jgi:hypothetical protein